MFGALLPMSNMVICYYGEHATKRHIHIYDILCCCSKELSHISIQHFFKLIKFNYLKIIFLSERGSQWQVYILFNLPLMATQFE